MKRIKRTRLTERQDKPSDPLRDRLAPLVTGQVVKLTVNYATTHGRNTREITHLLLLAPGQMYGMQDGTILVSVVGKGSCVVFPRQGKGLAGLVGSGIPTKLAKALMEQLTNLYGETQDGNS